MINCLIRYYFCSDDRVIHFEKSVRFPSVPFIGSHLSLSDEHHLHVEDVIFYEEEPPILMITTEKFADTEATELIDIMNRAGWDLVSDSTTGSKHT